jgi:hypothetical protein
MTIQTLDVFMDLNNECVSSPKSVSVVNLCDVERIISSRVKNEDDTRDKVYVLNDGRVEINPVVSCDTDKTLDEFLLAEYGSLSSSKSIPFVYLSDVKRMTSSEFKNAQGYYDQIYVLKGGRSEINPIVSSAAKKNKFKKNYTLLRYISTSLFEIAQKFDVYSSTSQGDLLLVRNAVLSDLKGLGIRRSTYRWSKHSEIVEGSCFINMDFYHQTHFYRETKTYAKLISDAQTKFKNEKYKY